MAFFRMVLWRLAMLVGGILALLAVLTLVGYDFEGNIVGGGDPSAPEVVYLLVLEVAGLLLMVLGYRKQRTASRDWLLGPPVDPEDVPRVVQLRDGQHVEWSHVIPKADRARLVRESDEARAAGYNSPRVVEREPGQWVVEPGRHRDTAPG